jgi:hypothetical protein
MTMIELSDRQVVVLRQALRLQEEAHNRNGFRTLESEASELRSYIADLVIDNARAVV